MKVRDIMTSPVQSCTADTNLAAAAGQMWDSDCGFLPVIDHAGKVIGAITDRDICIAVATKGRAARDVSVWETISGKLYACSPEDDVHEALKVMAANRVRRLPVVDEDGTLLGVLALNDLILAAQPGKKGGPSALSFDDVMNTLRAISAHRVLMAA